MNPVVVILAVGINVGIAVLGVLALVAVKQRNKAYQAAKSEFDLRRAMEAQVRLLLVLAVWMWDEAEDPRAKHFIDSSFRVAQAALRASDVDMGREVEKIRYNDPPPKRVPRFARPVPWIAGPEDAMGLLDFEGFAKAMDAAVEARGPGAFLKQDPRDFFNVQPPAARPAFECSNCKAVITVPDDVFYAGSKASPDAVEEDFHPYHDDGHGGQCGPLVPVQVEGEG